MVHVRLDDLENYAHENHIPIMQKDGIEFLINYIGEHDIKNILEIGTAIGYSAIRMALVNDKINVTTIERDEIRYNMAVENINSFNLSSRINIIYGDALKIDIPETSKYDLVFIDAAKAQYIKFFEKFEANLNTNGVIVSDNLSFHGMVNSGINITNRNTRQLVAKIKKYIEFLDSNKKYKTTFYDVGDGVSISVKI